MEWKDRLKEDQHKARHFLCAFFVYCDKPRCEVRIEVTYGRASGESIAQILPVSLAFANRRVHANLGQMKQVFGCG